MKKIFIVIIILVLLALVGAGVYYFVFVSRGVNLVKAPPKLITQQAPKPITPPSQAQQLQTIKQNFPEVIIGTIKFLDTKDSLKTTLETAGGKIYILWPAQPEAVYESLGVNNGNKVQVNGKPDGDELRWALMKPI